MPLAQPTLKDVAARVGVSVSTVSRVLRGDDSRPVDVATAARIRAVAHDLDYRPNLAARALARNEATQTSSRGEIGLVLGGKSCKFSDPFFSRVIDGIDAEMLANRLRLRFVYAVAELEEDPQRGALVRPEVVSGLIGVVLGPETVNRLMTSGVTPIVVIDGPDLIDGIDYVQVDKEGGVRQLMEHLWGFGHRRFAYLGVVAEDRYRHFRAWLALAGAPEPHVVDTDHRWDMEAGHEAMRSLRSVPRPSWPTAVVVACDTMAMGALRAAREMGVRVPQEMAMVGFDNTMGAFTNPPLTTIAVQQEQLGRLAVRRLLQRQRHPDEPSIRMILTTELVVRESCGARLDHTTGSPTGP